jgi:dimethylargininase
MIAITRAVPPTIAQGERTHLAREPIDLALARAQHRAYEEALITCGCSIVRLDALPQYPDSVFVEDTAIVLDDVAVLARPGAASRRGEVAAIEDALSRWLPLVRVQPDATLDAGDVLRLDRTLWVGRSRRTDAEAIRQLARLVAPFGYDVRGATMRDALHLKTAVTQVGERQLLVNPAWVDAAQFGDVEIIPVDPLEPFAANALMVGNRVIHSTAFPRTQDRLGARGIDIAGVDASELARAEGGVTCCSLLIRGKELVVSSE